MAKAFTSFRRAVDLAAASAVSVKALVATALGSDYLVGGVVWLKIRVESGGTVAKGDQSLVALTDGQQIEIGDSATEQVGPDGANIDLNNVYLYTDTAGVRVYIEIRCGK
jgi:hypothetical protein